MILKVFSPIGVLLDSPIQKVDFEAIDGFFTLLPKHVDFITALKPCILTYTTLDKKEHYLACNQGVLVKKGEIVYLSTKLGILDDNLEQLKKTIAIDFKEMEEARKETNKTMARLEVGLTKGLMQLNQQKGGPSAGL